LTENSFHGHHLPVFSDENEVAMATEQVFEEEFDYQLLFKPPENPTPVPDEVNLIEKYFKQLAAKELLGEAYVRDYLQDQKRRNCLRATQIIMRDAQKTRVGRVAYFSEDAGQALVAWLNQRNLTKDFVSQS
jgi:hypothetical protein